MTANKPSAENLDNIEKFVGIKFYSDQPSVPKLLDMEVEIDCSDTFIFSVAIINERSEAVIPFQEVVGRSIDGKVKINLFLLKPSKHRALFFRNGEYTVLINKERYPDNRPLSKTDKQLTWKLPFSLSEMEGYSWLLNYTRRNVEVNASYVEKALVSVHSAYPIPGRSAPLRIEIPTSNGRIINNQNVSELEKSVQSELLKGENDDSQVKSPPIEAEVQVSESSPVNHPWVNNIPEEKKEIKFPFPWGQYSDSESDMESDSPLSSDDTLMEKFQTFLRSTEIRWRYLAMFAALALMAGGLAYLLVLNLYSR
jgi:hypothetical protein